ncbi:MAG: hypothetical protein U0586_13125 [Candidatus Brocadiaceae bacterium]
MCIQSKDYETHDREGDKKCHNDVKEYYMRSVKEGGRKQSVADIKYEECH